MVVIYASRHYGSRACTSFTSVSIMRLLCYDCYSDDDSSKEFLFKCSAWVSAQPLGLRYYIREDRLSLALLADCYLVPRPTEDYYV